MATIVGLRRNKRTIAADEYFDIEVVDGQPRLTTLIILLKALAARGSSPKSLKNGLQLLDSAFGFGGKMTSATGC